jgi:transketolase
MEKSSKREELIAYLEDKARKIRVQVVKMCALESSHIGGSFSMADITAALYYHVMKIDPKNPSWEGRDYFVLSKGHTIPAVYPALADLGFFPEDALWTHLRTDSFLPGHACAKTPGVEVSTGSLGHGLSIGVGIALSLKADKMNNKVYVVMGDGELDEGLIWEGAMAGAHHQLDNLVAIVDRNVYQAAGPTERVLAIEPLADKWRSFGWATKVIDGHKMFQIVDTLEDIPLETGRPTAIIAETVKGKGVSFVEEGHWHMAHLNEEQVKQAFSELNETV